MALQPPPGLGGRELYSKEQWEIHKEVIKQLYNHENKPFKRVIDILRTEHSFFPTRRQFYRKISEWGFEKNIKDKEMRALVQYLSQNKGDGKGLESELRGQKVDLVKIRRWQRRYGRMKEVACRPTRSPSMTGSSSRNSNAARGHEFPMEALGASSHDPSAEVTEQSRIADKSSSWKFDYWNSVDVPGSPLLSRLFDALKIESETTIPAIDLDAILSSDAETMLDVDILANDSSGEWCSVSVGSSSRDLIRYSHEVFQESRAFSTDSDPGLTALSFSEWSFREWDFSRGQPVKANINQMFGLSPFPVSLGDVQKPIRPSPLATLHDFQFEETKFKRRLHQFKQIFGANNPTTLRTMQDLSTIYNMRGKYRHAERLCRQVVISYQETLGLKHFYTLSAYLDVITVLRNQGKLVSAYNIHLRIHNIIVSLFDQDHALVLQSNSMRTRMLYDSGQLDEADKLIRQTFQIELYTYGPRDIGTLDDMRVLAETSRQRRQFLESEQLLRFSLSLYRPQNGTFPVSFFKSMESLAAVLHDQERYEECRNLALTTAELLGNDENNGHHDNVFSLYLVAACTRMLGNLSESERQLRSVLEYCVEEDVCTCIYLQELAGVLRDMGRQNEAIPLLEKCYKVYLDMHGESRPYTISCGQELSAIYEGLGRYADAVPFLQKEVNYVRSQGGQHTRHFLGGLLRLARLLREGGQYSDAVPLYEECLHCFLETHRLLPTDHSTAQAIEGLSMCYEELGRDGDAVVLLRRHVNDARRNGYKPSPIFHWVIAKLARSLLEAQNPHEAVTLYEEYFPDIAEVQGLTDDLTITVLEEMVVCYCKLGRYEEILALLRQMSDEIRSTTGDQHPTLIDISEWMVEVRLAFAVYSKKANKSQSESDCGKSVTIEERIIHERALNTDDILAEDRDLQTGEDWMGELFDFDLMADPQT